MYSFQTFFFAHAVLKHFKSNIADVQSRRRIKRVSRRASLQSKSRKIRVLFLVIDSNTWNKLKPLYDAMRQRENIELKIVCMMPMPKQQDTSVTYRYFKDHGYDCIDARVGDGPWDVDDNGSIFARSSPIISFMGNRIMPIFLRSTVPM